MRPVWLTLMLLLGCVPAPKKNYTPAEIGAIDALDEVMHVLAHHADELMAMRDQTRFTEPELNAMVRVSPYLEAAALALQERFAGRGDFDEGFAEYAADLGVASKDVGAAAQAKQAPAAAAALRRMKDACASCHGEYR